MRAGKIVPLAPAIDPNNLPTLSEKQDSNCFNEFITKKTSTKQECFQNLKGFSGCVAPEIAQVVAGTEKAINTGTERLSNGQVSFVGFEGSMATFRVNTQ